MSATEQELVDMVAQAIQGELDLPDRLFEMRAGRHEAYLKTMPSIGGVAHFDVFERGDETPGPIASVKVTIEVETRDISSP